MAVKKSPYEWDDSLATNNELIDSQHKTLLKALKDLVEACGQGKGRSELDGAITFLADYTGKHFGDEEVLQKKYSFPDYSNHRRLHEGFKRVVAELKRELHEGGASVKLVGKVNSEVGNWLINHIKREDVKVADHIRENPQYGE
ncbi:MAG: bacteriohemerythrin [Oscillospiraceae bacterium]|nr:bacteriohemerythrin [Oscillospiraceae bacterium]